MMNFKQKPRLLYLHGKTKFNDGKEQEFKLRKNL